MLFKNLNFLRRTEMEYSIYLLILISIVWFMSHLSASILFIRISEVIPYDWKTREEIVGILKKEKIPNFCWLLVVPFSWQDVQILYDIHKNKGSFLFVFVCCGIDNILIILEKAGLIQKKVLKKIYLSEVLAKSVEFLFKIDNTLRRSEEVSVLSRKSLEELRKKTKAYTDKNNQVLNICCWKRVPRGRRSRKKKILKTLKVGYSPA